MTAAAPDRDALWRRYESARLLGGGPEECQFAFDQWWKAEKADALQTYKDEQRELKRKKAKAIR
jgi:hypothetical protein